MPKELYPESKPDWTFTGNFSLHNELYYAWRKNSGSYQSSYKQNYYRVLIHTGHQSMYSTVLPLGSLLCLEAKYFKDIEAFV